ncbi:Retrovirus-related Pol polyprotein from transposon TNT 1-94 [Podosphaera aphanis]|nr:Retrovirus-related Pol polyprotein from transposon TNT 1-94 [Podosphaera aphanis]
MRIVKGDKIWLEAKFDGSLPHIPEITDFACLTYEFWHEALCHSAPSSIAKTEKLIYNEDVIPMCPERFYSQACALSKSTHSTPRPASTRAKNRGEYIHSDLCGPFPVTSYGNSQYYISFVDDATRYSYVFFVKMKSEAAQVTIDFISYLETQYNCIVKNFRTDNGGEYLKQQLTKFFAQKGIEHDLTPPYSPESNGVAERLNRSIGEGIRAMLLPVKNKQLWAEAVKTYVYVKNRQFHGAVNKTPYEAFHGAKPSILHLQPFGRECYVHIPKAKRPAGSKLLPRAERGLFVGYTKVNHQYRIFVPEKSQVVISADVKFAPPPMHQANTESELVDSQHSVADSKHSSPPLMVATWTNSDDEPGTEDTNTLQQLDADHTAESLPAQSLSEPPISQPHSPQESTSTVLPHRQITMRQQNSPIVTRSGRQVRTRRFDDTITGEWWKSSSSNPSSQQPSSENSSDIQDAEGAMISVLEISEPRSYSEAKKSSHWHEWNKAFEDEIASLRENDVWKLVPRPSGRKVVGGKWVCKVKGNAQGELERFKARYVAKGFSQIQGLDYDETFAPVVRYDSLRLLLAISASKGWRPRQLDIKTAFLYGILNEEVYMELPEGYRIDNHVARLNRCIYGLKQSPREWYFRLVEYLKPFGLASTLFDPCVLIHNSGHLIIAVYVDDIILFGEQGDIILFGEQGDLMENTVNLLKPEFQVNDMGLLHWLLGIQIEYDNAGITLSQTAYIDRILTRFSMQDCNPVSSPIEHNHRLMLAIEGDTRAPAILYQQIIGSIMYLVSGTRPDLAYTISHLSQFNSDPSITHINAVKRVLRYLKGTKDQRILYRFDSHLVLNGFCDASYGNCYDTRRSFSGYLFQLGNSTINLAIPLSVGAPANKVLLLTQPASLSIWHWHLQPSIISG